MGRALRTPKQAHAGRLPRIRLIPMSNENATNSAIPAKDANFGHQPRMSTAPNANSTNGTKGIVHFGVPMSLACAAHASRACNFVAPAHTYTVPTMAAHTQATSLNGQCLQGHLDKTSSLPHSTRTPRGLSPSPKRNRDLQQQSLDRHHIRSKPQNP